jgi:hypothetical protein
MENAIHHLRAVSADSPMHRETADLLPLIELRMDRPQDFPAAEQARFHNLRSRYSAALYKLALVF